jgi:hypothetical protein
MRIQDRVAPPVFLLSFLFQLALAPTTIYVISLWIGDYVKKAALPYWWLDMPAAIVQLVLPDFAGFFLGYAARHFPGWFREPARWIGLAPGVLLCVGFVVSLFVDVHGPLVTVFGTQGTEYEGLGVVRLLFPVVACCLYSIGVRAGDRYPDPVSVDEPFCSGPPMNADQRG